jgi:hypothetical protein
MPHLPFTQSVQQVGTMYQTTKEMMSDPVIRVGDSAKKILQEESVKQAFDDLKSSLVTQWIAGKTPEDRESCWNAYHAANNLQNELNAQVQRSIRRKKQTSKGDE